jgi:hypothetical protein
LPLPLATTTVDVYRSTPAPNALPDELPDTEPTFSVVVSAARAHITMGAGRETGDRMHRAIMSAKLLVDSVGLDHQDVIVDKTTGIQWEVAWVDKRLNSLIDYETAQLIRRQVEVRAGEVKTA